MSESGDLKQRFMGRLNALGGSSGNTALRRDLGWADADYWRIRDGLIDDKAIVKYRAKGGAVRIAPPPAGHPTAPAAEVAEAAETLYERERELYEPMSTVLRGDWARDKRKTLMGVEITAQQGARATGGRWSRPDLVTVEVKSFLHVPGKFLEVTTFEVKPWWWVDVTAVYEALAHLRSAIHAYVVLHIPDERADALAETVINICDVAAFHGIGVIVASSPGDYTTWDERVEALRSEPDPERLDSFIEAQLPDALATRIVQALR